jgi:hypothetical protein
MFDVTPLQFSIVSHKNGWQDDNCCLWDLGLSYSDNVSFVVSNLDLSMGQKPLYPMHGLHIKKKTCCYRCSFRPFMWQATGFEPV